MWTKNSTGVAPDGRWFAGDVNALQDAVAAINDLTQTLGVGTLRVGETGLQFLRFGAGEARLTGAMRTDGIFRGLGGLVAGAFTTSARNAIGAGLAPFGLIILNTDLNQYQYNAGTDGARDWRSLGGSGTSTADTLANIPAASAANTGAFFYATDQDVLYRSTGAAWVRISSDHAGDVKMTLNAAADTGRVLLQGQAWPSTTGIWAALFAKWGAAFPTNLPDMRGRMPVNIGTHADINGIGLHEGVTVNIRRPKHGHGEHDHDILIFSHNYQGGGGATQDFASTPLVDNGVNTGLRQVGPPPATAPVDAPAYFTVNFEAKL